MDDQGADDAVAVLVGVVAVVPGWDVNGCSGCGERGWIYQDVPY